MSLSINERLTIAASKKQIANDVLNYYESNGWRKDRSAVVICLNEIEYRVSFSGNHAFVFVYGDRTFIRDGYSFECLDHLTKIIITVDQSKDVLIKEIDNTFVSLTRKLCTPSYD
jgi:hypothetical protein